MGKSEDTIYRIDALKKEIAQAREYTPAMAIKEAIVRKGLLDEDRNPIYEFSSVNRSDKLDITEYAMLLYYVRNKKHNKEHRNAGDVLIRTYHRNGFQCYSDIESQVDLYHIAFNAILAFTYE